MIIITKKIIKLLITSVIFLLFAALIAFPKNVTDTVVEALMFCFLKLIPSIYPSMVLSGIINKMELFGCSDSKIMNAMTKILCVPKRSLIPTVISYISGFVAGSKEIRYSQGYSSKKEYTSDIISATNAGLGFVVIFVGLGVFNSLDFGLFLYTVQIISSIALNKIRNRNTSLNKFTKNNKSVSFIKSFTNSVNDSTTVTLTLCGYVVIFSLAISIICSLTVDSIKPYISSILEISNGILSSNLLSSSAQSLFLCGFSVGFGGFCVIFQTISACENEYIDKIYFIKYKLIHGGICAIPCYFYALYKKISIFDSVEAISLSSTNFFSVSLSALFIFFLMLKLKNFLKNIDFLG